MSWRKNSSNRSRRKVLKQTAMTGLGTGALVIGGTPTTLASAPKARVAIKKGTYKKPVTLDDVEAANREVVEDYFDRGGQGLFSDGRTTLTERRAMGPSDRVALGIPGTMKDDAPLDDKYRTVGYVFTIGPDGVPTSYYGNVGNAGDVGETHQLAATTARKLREATTVEELPTDVHDGIEGGG